MKGIVYRFTYSTTVAITALLFCMTMILGSPLILLAQSGSPGAKQKASKIDRTESRIKELHSKLKITEAQEEQWNKLVQVMRDNAAAIEPLIKAREEKGTALNAVDDLKSYSKITDEHAAGLQKFISAFEPLYASMSDEQKKSADTIFTKHGHKRSKKK